MRALQNLSKRGSIRSLLACLLTIAVASCDRPKTYHGVVIDPPRHVAAFSFHRADSSTFNTAPVKGIVQLVFFGYTHCPDVCPTILADWARVHRKLGADTSHVRFLFVTVDPERDTPAVAQKYASQFSAGFIGLSGDSATTQGIQTTFGVASERGPGATGYFMGHSAKAFVVDDHGDIVLMYGFGSEWQSVADDLHTLLH